MIESLADIEALAARCHSEQSKGYIAEAIKCYRAGAYRAAIVSTWIAIVFDLVDKIRELAVAGDASAAAIERQYEGYIRQIEQNNPAGIKSALDFEREILSTCRDKLQFFDPQQFTDLMRLREDRHRCAHPSFLQVGIPYEPSAEQARVHIRNAVVYVLAQPPVQGKAAIAGLKALVASAYFPTDPRQAVTQLQHAGLAAASEPSAKSFIDLLIFNFLTPGDPLFYKESVLAAINATFEISPALTEERLRKQLNKAIRDVPDPQFSGAACLVCRIHSSWNLLEQASKDKLVRFITTGPAAEALPFLQPFWQFEEAKAAVTQRVFLLSQDELSTAIGSHYLRDAAKERALHFLSQTRSWNAANDAFAKLIMPLYALLTQADIERIIRMPRETGADLHGAHAFKVFIDNVRQGATFEVGQLNGLLSANGAEYLVPQAQMAPAGVA